jgi:hypothetical protein
MENKHKELTMPHPDSQEHPDYYVDEREYKYELGYALAEGFDSARDHFHDILGLLYGKDRMDLENLDKALDELSAFFEVRTPEGLPTVQRYGAEQKLHEATKDMLRKAGVEV